MPETQISMTVPREMDQRPGSIRDLLAFTCKMEAAKLLVMNHGLIWGRQCRLKDVAHHLWNPFGMGKEVDFTD